MYLNYILIHGRYPYASLVKLGTHLFIYLIRFIKGTRVKFGRLKWNKPFFLQGLCAVKWDDWQTNGISWVPTCHSHLIPPSSSSWWLAISAVYHHQSWFSTSTEAVASRSTCCSQTSSWLLKVPLWCPARFGLSDWLLDDDFSFPSPCPLVCTFPSNYDSCVRSDSYVTRD